MGMDNAARSEPAGYGAYWDYYVDHWKDYHQSENAGLEWAGDEWGNPLGWEGLYREIFNPAGVADWQRVVEIGPGSGKYTLKVLGDSACRIRAYDVSSQFLKVCEQRCRDWIDQERLSLHLLEATRPDELLLNLRGCGWERSVDCFFSIDAMVHVDLQYLIAYLLTAALVLKPNGKLLLTLSDATRDAGFQKLLRDIHWTFPAQGRPLGSGKFEWLSPDLVRSILPRLGFKVQRLGESQRDLRLIAELTEPNKSESLAQYLSSPAKPESTRP